ncbi:MAG: M20/M25/M40 family metallo-hydrolase [Candidatus Peribacteraceae bacterium]|nr:M20/M25/M40 family metallo-hydrolase [Candidatus Peribacteraceae bacterium]MDD5742439.1 M20/M25/M40 family metallo-hydrolase [Candidatus Peribacteraceae bacterium]
MKSIAAVIDEIAEITQSPEGRNSIALTESEDRTIEQVRTMAVGLFKQYGIDPTQYEIQEDAFGNMFITFFGEDRQRAVMSGSHVDSVKNGGKFDGVAGVASAIQFLERILQEKKQLKHNYTVVVFRAEESSPTTGVACLGSKIATGTITKEALEKIRYIGADGQETLLREHFIRRYGSQRWERVLEELEHPHITPENSVHYEEVHIEQSRLGEMMEADVGIVSGGIGGARRERVRVPAEKVQKEELVVSESTPYVRLKIMTKGRAEHSGGTPPNTVFVDSKKGSGLGPRGDGRMITRSDALVALSNLIAHIEQYRMQLDDPEKYPAHVQEQIRDWNRRAEQSGFPRWAHIERITTPIETGFTTIPANQEMDVILPKQNEAAFRQLIQQNSGVLSHEGVGYEITTEPIDPGTYSVLPFDQAFAATGMAGAVANAVEMHVLGRWVVDPRGVSTVGEVRATVTDFQLDPSRGLSFNIDERNVDSVQGKKLAESVSSIVDGRLALMGIDPKESRLVVSDTAPSPIDRQSVETKQGIAQTLGFKTVVMPSVPGQDAGSISKAGVPTSMTFIRHPGVSHSSEEFVDPKYVENAVAISHAYLERLLKL